MMKTFFSNLSQIVGKAVRLIVKIRSNLGAYFQPLTANEKEFVKMNSEFWRRYQSGNQAGSDGYVLVVPELYPLILVGNAQISAFLAANKNAKLLFIVPSRFDRRMREVLKSFPEAAFVFEDSLRYSLYKLRGYFLAKRMLASFKAPDDVLHFKIDDILFGDSIYDSFLFKGYATLKDLSSPELKKVLRFFFYQRLVALDILRRYKIKSALLSHIIGISGGVFLRYFLRNNIEVYVREATIKKYNRIEMMHECGTTADKRYINFMKEHADYFIPLAEESLKMRLDDRAYQSGGHLPYLRGKRVFSDRKDFGKFFNFDPDKKNVFVMLHSFNDFPHTYGFTIQRDFYEWFRAVLKIAQETPSVNWIFKEHPYSRHYPTKDLDLDAVFSKINLAQIRFLNKDANFNTGSLKNIADTIVTSLGTAGLEYSSFGIPCILAGRCWYSGFGFTIEPKTEEDFARVLRNVATLPRLNQEQINTAKIVSFFTFEVVNVTKFADPFHTVCTLDIEEQRAFTSEQCFQSIVEHRNKSHAEEKEKYIKDFNEFVSNSNFRQFVDLGKYDFFRKAIDNSYVKNSKSLTESLK